MQIDPQLLLAVAVVLLAAIAGAELARLVGLPSVLGETLAGLLLGPSLLGLVAPGPAFELLAGMGVVVLMFIAGLETDLPGVRRVGRAAFLTALGGVLLSLFGGILAAQALSLAPQALFLGVALTATSVSISAQTLRELGRLQATEGSTVLGAALVDDVLGVLLLSILLGATGGDPVWLALAKVAVFFPVTWFAGGWLVRGLVVLKRHLRLRSASLALVLGLLLIYAWAAAFASLAPVTGAYVLGLLVARYMGPEDAARRSAVALGLGFLVPIFFANLGLQAHLAGLFTAPATSALLILVAVLGKVIGCGIGALAGGLAWRPALLAGIGMVPRGEVTLVIAGAGLAAGVLDVTLFSVLIALVLIASLLTPALLRLGYALMDRPGGGP